MKKLKIYYNEMIRLLDHNLIFWMILDKSKKSREPGMNSKILDVSQKFVSFLGLKAARIINKPVDTLLDGSKNEIQKKLFRYILSSKRNPITLSTRTRQFKISKHNLRECTLITAQRKTLRLSKYC